MTNAHKHGDGSVSVTLRFDDEALEIVVINRARSDAAGTSGYGLVGMQERVETIGGELSIDRAGGQFTVRAHIPVKGTA